MSSGELFQGAVSYLTRLRLMYPSYKNNIESMSSYPYGVFFCLHNLVLAALPDRHFNKHCCTESITFTCSE